MEYLDPHYELIDKWMAKIPNGLKRGLFWIGAVGVMIAQFMCIGAILEFAHIVSSQALRTPPIVYTPITNGRISDLDECGRHLSYRSLGRTFRTEHYIAMHAVNHEKATKGRINSHRISSHTGSDIPSI